MTEIWNTVAQVAHDALQDVDPVRAVATLAVGYAVFKLVHLAVTAPVIPPSVWVPLEPGENYTAIYGDACGFVNVVLWLFGKNILLYVFIVHDYS